MPAQGYWRGQWTWWAANGGIEKEKIVKNTNPLWERENEYDNELNRNLQYQYLLKYNKIQTTWIPRKKITSSWFHF